MKSLRRIPLVFASVILLILTSQSFAQFALPASPVLTEARRQAEPRIRALFAKAQVPYPAREIFLRAFKSEGLLELWAREDQGPFRLISAYPVLARSGGPGPKLREGDRQVPEGVYFIERFNPLSAFHLSLGLSYPSPSDLLRADPKAPGSDIFIHGGAVSIGCLPLGDPAIEEVFLAALDSRQRGQTKIPVHIFPARMHGPAWLEFSQREIQRDSSLASFWQTLLPIYSSFERTRRL